MSKSQVITATFLQKCSKILKVFCRFSQIYRTFVLFCTKCNNLNKNKKLLILGRKNKKNAL